ncbi:hypothetical protein [Geobacter sp. SVR]|uniref:hypothetical protein n=1 Tax=Geobacter sp. SVR TaxID=2495594 RepID=UPI00143F01A0|nr:hypothetical protein [Geobacter sp. SVR]BCS53661.1 hypothetical protein GSVR_19690 [Geobacter sp. SVR]GCF84142.1 hypothetical protein GSbR_07420 [Geobacter sp. SVR]
MTHEVWSIVCTVALAGWIGSALVLAFRAFPEKGRLSIRSAVSWGTVLVISYALWVVGLLQA